MDKVLIETYDNLRRAFAMMALAMVSNRPREQLFKKERVLVSVGGVMQEVTEEVAKVNLPSEFRAVRLPNAVADKLRDRVARGDVTTIVPSPEPFTWLVVTTIDADGNSEELRTIYGIWVGRPASWRGKINPANLPHIGAMTPQEAEAKGIPVPNLAKE